MPTHFSPAGLRFLNQLSTHNHRAGGNERQPVFERDVQAPWLALLAEVNEALADFAPESVTPARKAALRIYRDIRFSKNKQPYKTHVAAWFSSTTTERTSGGGFYVQVSPDAVIVAAGVYQPQPDQLLAIRRYLQQHHAELRALLGDPERRALLPELDSHPLTRMPKGFAPDDPAADLLLCRQWALSARLPAAVACTPQLLDTILQRFRSAAPVVHLLNNPLRAAAKPRKPLF